MLALVGGLSRIDTPRPGGSGSSTELCTSLFPRLVSEVTHVPDVSRLIGFRADLNDAQALQFFGIEVDEIEAVPHGMVGWMLDDHSFEMTDADGLRETQPIEWVWRDARDRDVGEFRSRRPAVFEGGRPRTRGNCLWWMTTNAYTGRNEEDAREDAVELVAYDPSWPKEFARMSRQLKERFPSAISRIEHYGSTAIPGIPAKPVIDMLVETPSFEMARRELIPGFNDETWEYWWYAGHMVFIKRERLMGKRTHHLHVAPSGHRLWEGLAFRDYLIAHPETAQEYARLKIELCSRHGDDREQYTDAKSAFVKSVTAKALAKNGPRED
jgi:GrpB-like predicted nucleotidyltransferase (UPF0157 family)